MTDCVPPFVHVVQSHPAIRVLRMVSGDQGPERETKPSEIRSDMARIRIASVEFSVGGEIEHCNVAQIRIRDGADQQLGTFVMKRPAVTLKLARQHHRIRLVDLERRSAHARAGAAKRLVRSLHLVERRSTLRKPSLQRERRHRAVQQHDICRHYPRSQYAVNGLNQRARFRSTKMDCVALARCTHPPPAPADAPGS